MTTARKLALIVAGYAVAVAGGLVVVAINELLIPVEVSASSGMVAFGDVVLFVLVAGFLGLAPTWFLLKLSVEKVPRVLVVAELLVAATGPASWLAMIHAGGGADSANISGVASELLELVGPTLAILRIVFGPVLLMIEGLTLLMVRARTMRALLAVAMLMDLIPLGIFAAHVVQARYN